MHSFAVINGGFVVQMLTTSREIKDPRLVPVQLGVDYLGWMYKDGDFFEPVV